MAFIMAWQERTRTGRIGGMALLAGFRGELYRCLGMRRDALFELADAVLCRPERVHMLAELSLEPECRRGHGARLRRGELRGGPDRAAAPGAGRAAAAGAGMTAGSGWPAT